MILSIRSTLEWRRKDGFKCVEHLCSWEVIVISWFWFCGCIRQFSNRWCVICLKQAECVWGTHFCVWYRHAFTGQRGEIASVWLTFSFQITGAGQWKLVSRITFWLEWIPLRVLKLDNLRRNSKGLPSVENKF